MSIDEPTTRQAKLWWGITAAAVILVTMGYGCWPVKLTGEPERMTLLQLAADPMAQKPLDIVALVQVIFTGLALVISAAGGVYAAIAASRAKRAEEATKANNENIGKVQTDVKLIERNTNSMTTRIAQLAEERGAVAGERKGMVTGQETARVLAEGQRQGVESERASVAAATSAAPAAPAAPAASAALTPASPDVEVATRDKRVAAATERSADAQERVAKAAEAAEGKPPKKP